MWFETQTVLRYTYEINAEHASHDCEDFSSLFSKSLTFYETNFTVVRAERSNLGHFVYLQTV